jgi:hypothetical protein
MLDGIPEENTPELLCRSGVDPADIVLIQVDETGEKSGDDRGISVGRDASGNAFVTGDNNSVKVVIYQSVSKRRQPEEAASAELGPNPYMGLLAFHEEDADRFFGREEQIARLWEKLRGLHQKSSQDSATPRLLPILGPSGSGKSPVARAAVNQRVAAGEDLGKVERVIDSFAHRKARLITLSSADETAEGRANKTAEVTHEALFDDWDSLRKWIDENRDSLKFKQRLGEAVREWEENARDESYLYGGQRLTRAEERAQQNAGELNQGESEFVAASGATQLARKLLETRQPEVIHGELSSKGKFALPAMVMLVANANYDSPVRHVDRGAAIAQWLLDHDGIESLVDLLRHTRWPDLRTHLIHNLPKLGATAELVIEQLDREHEVSVRRALILTLTEFPADSVSQPEKHAVVNQPLQRYEHDAAAYCNWLSQQEVIPEDQLCYLPNSDGVFDAGMAIAPDFHRRNGYRLPSEHEWEFACRAGSENAYCFGDSEAMLANYACFAENSDRTMFPVGSLKPNDFGLFDMHGNAWEWCQDSYRSLVPTDNPVEDLTVNDADCCVLRGGSFDTNAPLVRSAYRLLTYPDNRSNNVGFRVASTLRQTLESVAPESAVQTLVGCPAECAKCKVQAVVPRRAVCSSAKYKIGPAGLVGRKIRTPCRAIFVAMSPTVSFSHGFRRSRQRSRRWGQAYRIQFLR